MSDATTGNGKDNSHTRFMSWRSQPVPQPDGRKLDYISPGTHELLFAPFISIPVCKVLMNIYSSFHKFLSQNNPSKMSLGLFAANAPSLGDWVGNNLTPRFDLGTNSFPKLITRQNGTGSVPTINRHGLLPLRCCDYCRRGEGCECDGYMQVCRRC